MIPKTVCISIDVEDWFQVENLRPSFPLSVWDKQDLRVGRSTDVVLEILARHRVRGTFFMLGWVADRLPQTVRDIISEGHEIGCHGYSHVMTQQMSHSELREDIYRAKSLLEDFTGSAVRGYRAPSFSISEDLLTLLKDLRFDYDSSLNPFGQHDRYGALDSCVAGRPFRHKTGIVELPMATLEIFNLDIPISGGGFFRLYPERLFNAAVKAFFKSNDCYIFYLHPWEFDPDQPKVRDLSAITRFRHYNGLQRTARRFDRFLGDVASYQLSPIGEALDQLQSHDQIHTAS